MTNSEQYKKELQDLNKRLKKLIERWDRDGRPETPSEEPTVKERDPFLDNFPGFIEEVSDLKNPRLSLIEGLAWHVKKEDSMTSLCAFGDATRDRIQAGDVDALVSGIAALAGLWFRSAGADIQSIGLAASAYQDQGNHSLLLAAISLRDVLLLSPQGREAIANLGPKPVFQNTKSERG